VRDNIVRDKIAVAGLCDELPPTVTDGFGGAMVERRWRGCGE